MGKVARVWYIQPLSCHNLLERAIKQRTFATSDWHSYRSTRLWHGIVRVYLSLSLFRVISSVIKMDMYDV